MAQRIMCYGLNGVHPDKRLRSKPSEPVNVTLSGDRVFVPDQVKVRSLGCAFIRYNRALIKGTNLNLDTHKEKTM